MLIKALAAAAGNFGGGYSIENSLRFNDNDSANLDWTPSVDRSANVWTISVWFKRGLISSSAWTPIWEADQGGNSDTISIYQDKLYIGYASGTSSLTIPDLFRDSSGWYHLVISWDVNETGLTDTLKIWVNGVRKTNYSPLFGSLISDSTVLNFGRNVENRIGARSSGTLFYFDGYLAETNFIDGQALTADDFGEINADTGEWSPIAYAGTYGTNGFYLPFDGNANDDSGNGNNWTENNIASTDFMIDTPTNNFSVLNPLVPSYIGSNVFSQGNLRSSASSNSGYPESTIYINSGKWYVEMCYESGGGSLDNNALGFTDTGGGADSFSSGIMYRTRGQIHINGSLSTTVASYTVGDIVAMSIDADSGEVKFYKNNTLVYTGSSLTYTRYIPFVYNREAGSLVLNFGQDSSFAGNKTRQGNTDANGIGDFYYAPPAGGYLALCTDNLPAPAIEQPETQFNVVTYTGNGGTQDITGVGFQPDFVWLKERNSAVAHFVYDSVRGATLGIHTNLSDAEGVYSDGLTAFTSDGFTLGSRSNNNGSGDTYVAWCLKAGGTAVTNTDGTITSQVSANVDAGFSIVGYTGNGTAGANVGHGLSSAPDMMIVKNRTSVDSWAVYHSSNTSAPETERLLLNSTAATADSAVYWNDTAPTSSVFTIGDNAIVNQSSNNYIAYCFHSVESFSKFGSYVGNGSTNGPYIYTGFKPAFVMLKRTDAALYNWIIFDSARDPSNQVQHLLYPNLSDAEGTGLRDDMYSNGFKIRQSGAGVNASGGTYIYMAFAEHPFKYATGR